MASNKSNTHIMALSANWQALFITATLLGWLSMIASLLLSYAISRYFSDGTWAFQISIILQPVAFFVAAFLLLGHYRPVMKRIFMACLATTIGMALYGTVALWERQLWFNTYNMQHPISATDTSWWSAFGNDWTMMLLGLVVYTFGLYVATRKARR